MLDKLNEGIKDIISSIEIDVKNRIIENMTSYSHGDRKFKEREQIVRKIFYVLHDLIGTEYNMTGSFLHGDAIAVLGNETETRKSENYFAIKTKGRLNNLEIGEYDFSKAVKFLLNPKTIKRMKKIYVKQFVEDFVKELENINLSATPRHYVGEAMEYNSKVLDKKIRKILNKISKNRGYRKK